MKAKSNEIYLSLKEDIEDEIKQRYNLSDKQIEDLLEINQLKERYFKNPDQFDYFEVDELATLLYETYKELNNPQ